LNHSSSVEMVRFLIVDLIFLLVGRLERTSQVSLMMEESLEANSSNNVSITY